MASPSVATEGLGRNWALVSPISFRHGLLIRWPIRYIGNTGLLGTNRPSVYIGIAVASVRHVITMPIWWPIKKVRSWRQKKGSKS